MLATSMALGVGVRAVSKRFGRNTAVDRAQFEVNPGEVVAVTGPSGAGKTTTCRLIAGLDQPDAGRIELGGRDVTHVAAGSRRVALMFESYALYPHLTVFENAASPLRVPGSGIASGEVSRRVTVALGFLEIDHLAERLPSELSGGQRQRVALARALCQSPSALLLDEPISHLDAKLRHRLRGEIKRRLNDGEVPVVWCTPDGIEALSVGDRVVVLIGGRVEQIGTPDDIWFRPRTTRVAKLIGDPPMNLVSGTVEGRGGAASLVARDGIALSLGPAIARLVKPGGRFVLGVRADAARLAAHAAAGSVKAEIYAVEPFGKWSVVSVRLAGELFKLKTHEAPSLKPGAPVGVVIDDRGCVVFDGETGTALTGGDRPDDGGQKRREE